MKKLIFLNIPDAFDKHPYATCTVAILIVILAVYLLWKIWESTSYEHIKCKAYLSRYVEKTNLTDIYRWADVRKKITPIRTFQNENNEIIKEYLYQLHRRNGEWHRLTKKQVNKIIETTETKEFPEFDLLSKDH